LWFTSETLRQSVEATVYDLHICPNVAPGYGCTAHVAAGMILLLSCVRSDEVADGSPRAGVKTRKVLGVRCRDGGGGGMKAENRRDAVSGGLEASRSRHVLRRPASWRRAVSLPILGLALAVVGWAAATLLLEQLRFAVFAPQAQAGVEAASALARLFGALVLVLFLRDRLGERALWVASGLLVLGLGGLAFGYLKTLLGTPPDLNAAAYESLSVRTLAAALFVVGLMPSTPPRLGRRLLAIALVVLPAIGLAVEAWEHLLPPLVLVADPNATSTPRDSSLALAGWHWAPSVVPFGLAVSAAVGAALGYRRGSVPGWLLAAMVLFAGSQLHNLFWPSSYGLVLTTADLLRLAFAAVLLGGVVFELVRVAQERAGLLAAERERSRRLGELSALKADFTAMVAHELGSPVAAVRRLTDLLDIAHEDPELWSHALNAIRRETDAIKALVSDVRATATAESDDFAAEPRPVALAELLAEARFYAESLPGEHPVGMYAGTVGPEEKVWADPERIEQVLRNLLSNAAKYSPDGAPVEVRVLRDQRFVRIEVADHGSGIHPDDSMRIFEKFGRGRDVKGHKVQGVGLGLYLSRGILRSHGSELEARSTPGEGSVFSFELEVVQEAEQREDSLR
jgi:signal transduction histidine kinase